MYDVTIRKTLRHADGTTVVEELSSQVNHERHALNLAGRIARDKGVEFVEIEEVNGRFNTRAELQWNGRVVESLDSKRARPARRGSTKGLKRHSHRRRLSPMVAVIIVAVLGLGAFATRGDPPTANLFITLLSVFLIGLFVYYKFLRR